MQTDDSIDLVAASRIAKRVDIREIRLTDLSMSMKAEASNISRLVPTHEHSCAAERVEGDTIEVSCAYTFKVRSNDVALAEASMTYRIVYTLIGDEAPERSDVDQFARANGAYHSWPFARQEIFSLTSKMGFPPYTLPVLVYKPKPTPKPEPEAIASAVAESGADN